MDTNDQREGQYTGKGQDNQYNPNGCGQNNGQSSSAYYGSGDPGNYQGVAGGPRKKGRGAMKAIIAVLMVLCLLAGGILTAYVIMPSIYPSLLAQSPAQIKPTLQPNRISDASGTEGPKSLTTDTPDIGGQAPNINSLENPIVQIAKEVGPAVVGITVSANQAAAGQAANEQAYGYATGIIISPDGYIVTNDHVTIGSDSILVTLNNGAEYNAKLVGSDIAADLAVIKIDAAGLTAASLGDSDGLQVGEPVVAIGNPLGKGLEGSVTSGIVSALNREITTNGYSQKYIQTDTAINPGNSGGPLVSIKGQVIGIVTLKSYLAEVDDYGMPISSEGLGFAIPISIARPVIEQLITKGSVIRPGIGITCTVDTQNQYNPVGSPAGVTVLKVITGGPADIAGIEINDIIVSVDGTPVSTVDALLSILKTHKVGDVVNMTVWRSGQEYTTKVTIADVNNIG